MSQTTQYCVCPYPPCRMKLIWYIQMFIIYLNMITVIISTYHSQMWMSRCHIFSVAFGWTHPTWGVLFFFLQHSFSVFLEVRSILRGYQPFFQQAFEQSVKYQNVFFTLFQSTVFTAGLEIVIGDFVLRSWDYITFWRGG